VHAADSTSETKKGDIVLISRQSSAAKFSIQKVIYKIDDIIDPITGKRASHEDDQVREHLEAFSKSLSKN
jgi:hypothetical protein